MSVFTHADELTLPAEELFAIFLRPALAVALAPANFPLELLDGPEILVPGALLTLRTRRYGLAQKFIHRVESVEPLARLVYVQVRGPFRSYRLMQSFERLGEGCQLVEEVQFDPPGGVLGQFLTEARLRGDFEQLYRERRVCFQSRGWLAGT
jgi:ligand-binding SRPBCC domain-containing protein